MAHRCRLSRGAGLASVAWFTALGFGARLLAWRVLDLGVGATMIVLATGLVGYAFGGSA